MPRIVTYFLGTYPCPSETFIQREIDALRRRGWAIDVVSLYGASAISPCSRGRWPRFSTALPPNGPLLAATLRHALPLLFHLPRLPLQLLRHLPQILALTQRLRTTHQSTGIHAHFAHLPADVALLAARHAGVRFTCSVHAWDVFAQPPAAIYRRLQSAAAVCACSQAAVNAVCAAGIETRRVHLIRHGLPLAEYAFVPGRGGRRILAVGRLEPKKGFDALLAACVQLHGIPFSCQIIGEGTQRHRLEQLIAAHQLGDRVSLRGAATADEVRTAMRTADVLVLPSRRLASGDHDGVANVLIEAMALGTPVITTTAGAAGEVVRDGINGLLVPPENAAALTTALDTLIGDPTTRTHLARAARTTVETDFNEDRTIAQMEDVLKRPA